MPSWFNTDILNKLITIDNVYFQLQANTNEKKRLAGGILKYDNNSLTLKLTGVWANKVMADMESKINYTLKDMKMFLYSAVRHFIYYKLWFILARYNCICNDECI